MPDFDLVIEMANFFDVGIEELLDGERKENTMEKIQEESLLKVAEYGNDEKLKFSKRLFNIFIAGLIALIIYMFLETQGLTETKTYDNIASFMLGFVFSVLLIGIMYTSKYMVKIRLFKQRLLKRNE